MLEAMTRKIRDFEESLGHTKTISEIIERIDKLEDSSEIVPFYIRDWYDWEIRRIIR